MSCARVKNIVNFGDVHGPRGAKLKVGPQNGSPPFELHTVNECNESFLQRCSGFAMR
jgi:hypothetical protein